jgi:hypothetical protein
MKDKSLFQKHFSQVTNYKLEKQGSILDGGEIFLFAKICSPALESITPFKPVILKLLAHNPKS